MNRRCQNSESFTDRERTHGGNYSFAHAGRVTTSGGRCFRQVGHTYVLFKAELASSFSFFFLAPNSVSAVRPSPSFDGPVRSWFCSSPVREVEENIFFLFSKREEQPEEYSLIEANVVVHVFTYVRPEICSFLPPSVGSTVERRHAGKELKGAGSGALVGYFVRLLYIHLENE